MLFGVLLGIAACLVWGFVYLVPLMLPGYDPLVIATGRYVSFGLVALPLWLAQRREFRHYRGRDWSRAILLGMVGNCVYYWLLVNCVNLAGAPFAGMCMSLIPVLVALIANRRAAGPGSFLPWSRLAPALALLGVGLVLANVGEFELVAQASRDQPWRFWLGVGYGVAALLVWTWYPICNADWLRRHPDRSAGAWTTAQGLATLPLATVGFLLISAQRADGAGFWGPEPALFIFLMIVSGLGCSWLGTALWSEMSQRLPTALGGQLIVFETIFAVLYSHAFRGQWPRWSMIIGMILLITGVLASLRIFERAARDGPNAP